METAQANLTESRDFASVQTSHGKHQLLMKISYHDYQASVHLEAYADTIVLEKDGKGANNLVAIRFGGYPESVRGMADAIYGGGSIGVEAGENRYTLTSMVK